MMQPRGLDILTSRATAEGLRESLCCERCNKLLGEIVAGSVFISTQQRRVIVGSLPIFVICEDCGGVWHNPAHGLPEALVTMLAAFREYFLALPRAPVPERNWGPVPNDRRAAAFRERV